MRELTTTEIEMVSGGQLTATEGALLELAVAGGAFAIGSAGLGLVAIAAAGALLAYS